MVGVDGGEAEGGEEGEGRVGVVDADVENNLTYLAFIQSQADLSDTLVFSREERKRVHGIRCIAGR